MKISEITLDGAKDYLRVGDNSDDKFIEAVMAAAEKLIISYTGIPKEELDNYEDLSIAFYCICSDMYDVRSMAVQSERTNPTVKLILNMHSRNLV